ncbi:1-acyl-sn-glycerol-3-phosphate acyltransferase [Diutina catenulata]
MLDRLVVALTVVIALVSMAAFSARIKFLVKSIVFAFSIAGCALYGVVASIFLRLIGKPQYSQYTVARAFLFVIGKLLRIKVRVKNEQYLRQNPAIYISNHQSALDVLVLGRIFQPGMSVTAKSSLKYVPFLGWFMLLSGTFFLNRQKSEKARRVLNSALGQLKTEKRGLFIFPEGTRSGYDKLDMLPFKKGAFHLAKEAGIPVVPIVVSNTSTIFHSATKIFNTGVIDVEVLPPVPMAGVTTSEEVTEVTARVRDDMIKVLRENVGYSEAPLGSGIKKAPVSAATKGSETTPLINKDDSK